MATNETPHSSMKLSQHDGSRTTSSVASDLASGDGRMEQEVLEADLILPSALPFKKVQAASVTDNSGNKEWNRLKQMIQSENYKSDEPSYVSIQSLPSRYPPKTYCDITGFPTSYRDPKTKLRYADVKTFKRVRSLSDEDVQSYLALRKAGGVVLK